MKKVVIFALALVSLFMTSCCDPYDPDKPGKPYDDVMIMLAVGRNNLHSDLHRNIDQLCEGFVPEKDSRKAIVVIGNFMDSGSPQEVNCPYVVRLYKEGDVTVEDTVKAFSHNDRLTSVTSLDSIIRYVARTFDSEKYGLIYSSHGSGWLPENYYNPKGNPNTPRKSSAIPATSVDIPEGAFLYVEPEPVPGKPAVRTMGLEQYQTGATVYAYEMTAQQFVKAMPVKLDYLIFDACFMSGIEVAYELRNTCNILMASCAEVIAAGMDYSKMGERLLADDTHDVIGVAQDYYRKYNERSGSYRSATVSVVDCSKLGQLAGVCAPMFAKYREEIANMDESKVQGFFVNKDKWFYDLEDLLVQAGADKDEQAQLTAALDQCVLYRMATPMILGEKEVLCHCGFSTYLPNQGTAYLDEFYKTLSWNDATGFVE